MRGELLLKPCTQRHQMSTQQDYISQVELTSGGQYPFATVLSCIDSRATPESLFDLAIGDAFVPRIAGNIVNPDILGSMEFASAAAGSKLIVVLGHTHCGAVKGACDGVKLGNLTGLLNKIRPAVDATPNQSGADRSSKNDLFVDAAALTNVRLTTQAIRRDSEVLRGLEQAGKLRIVAAMLNVQTGKVEFLPD